MVSPPHHPCSNIITSLTSLWLLIDILWKLWNIHFRSTPGSFVFEINLENQDADILVQIVRCGDLIYHINLQLIYCIIEPNGNVWYHVVMIIQSIFRQILRVKFIADSISGSFKACLPIHIFLETGRHWLEMTLVDFFESSGPNICDSGPDFI